MLCHLFASAAAKHSRPASGISVLIRDALVVDARSPINPGARQRLAVAREAVRCPGTCSAQCMNMSHRVLIVDDEPAISFALSEYFTVRGYEVDSAVAVQEAETLLGRACYDILITDLSINGRGGAEGLELAGLVRRHHPRTRIIILTAYGSAASEAAARRLGVDVFLHKPMPLGDIAQVLDRLAEEPDTALDNLDLSGASRQPQSNQAESPSTQS